jgi:hypothetical protein
MKLTKLPKPRLSHYRDILELWPRLSDYRDILERWPILVGIVAVTAAAPFLWELFDL